NNAQRCDGIGRQPLSSRKLEFYSSETPAGEGIGTPKAGTSIGPVGAIERKARVPARTDDRASRSTWRVRPTFWTLTNMLDFLALTDGGTPIGHCLKRKTSRVHNRKNRRHYEHSVTHSALLYAFSSIDKTVYCGTSNENKASYYCLSGT